MHQGHLSKIRCCCSVITNLDLHPRMIPVRKNPIRVRHTNHTHNKYTMQGMGQLGLVQQRLQLASLFGYNNVGGRII